MELLYKLKQKWIATLWLSVTASWMILFTLVYLQQVDRQQQVVHQLDAKLAESDGTIAGYEAQLNAIVTFNQDLLAVVLVQADKTLFSSADLTPALLNDSRVERLMLTTPSATKLELQIYFRPPLRSLLASPWWWGGLIINLLLLGLLTQFLTRYLQQAGQGVLQLQQLCNGILEGQHLPSSGMEYPYEAAEALDMLQQQLKTAQQERHRFDQFIRDSTFTDIESGFGNRKFFDNRLEAVLKDSEVNDGGAVYLLQLQELEIIKEQLGEAAATDVVVQFSQILGQLLADYNDVVIARRSEEDFAALVPNLLPREIEELGNKLIRGLRRLALPDCVVRDAFLHIGIAPFRQGDDAYQILSETDMALRAAQLQGPNSWFMYERGVIERGHALGSVRWRSLLENAIARRSFVMFTQSAVTAVSNRIHHHEVLARVRDDRGVLVSAGVFLPMASRCGLLPKIDRLIIEQLIKLLEYERADNECCSINLSSESLLDRDFMDWFVSTLSRTPQLAKRIIIEISEYHVYQRQKAITQPLNQIRNLGCHLLVDRVGQIVVSSQYINQLSVEYLKLHQSIVRDIHQHPENQLFVRSLFGTLGERKVKIFALGVESEAEWRMLKNLGVYGGQGHFFSESLETVAACSSPG
jgi:RNase E specificity factor CsrD